MCEDPTLSQTLKRFKPLLHPTRLTIMIFLNRRYRMELSELRRAVDVPWGTLESHFKTLVKHGLVSTRREFSGESPRLYAYLEPNGAKLFSQFMKVMGEIE